VLWRECLESFVVAMPNNTGIGMLQFSWSQALNNSYVNEYFSTIFNQRDDENYLVPLERIAPGTVVSRELSGQGFMQLSPEDCSLDPRFSRLLTVGIDSETKDVYLQRRLNTEDADEESRCACIKKAILSTCDYFTPPILIGTLPEAESELLLGATTPDDPVPPTSSTEVVSTAPVVRSPPKRTERVRKPPAPVSSATPAIPVVPNALVSTPSSLTGSSMADYARLMDRKYHTVFENGHKLLLFTHYYDEDTGRVCEVPVEGRPGHLPVFRGGDEAIVLTEEDEVGADRIQIGWRASTW
jgi:hypothetical protein